MGSGAKPKSKRRNSDKRKEKSRDAARTRRSKESEIFNNLLKEIPVSMGILSQLDKASVIRLAITHLKLRAFFQSIFDGKDIMCTFPSAELESKLNKLYYKAINGFIMIITNTGNLVYITESINQHLGLSQIDMLGQNILDFIHPCDHDEMKDIWSSKNTTTTTNDNNNNNNNNTTNNNTNNILSSNMITTMEPSSSTPCLTTALNADTTVSKRMKLTSKKNILSASSSTMSLSTDNLTNNEHLKKMKKDFFVRMKSVQFSKSRSTSHKSSSYRVIHCSGYLISTHSSSAPSSTPSLKFPPNSSLSLPASPSSSLSSPSSPSLLNYSVPSSSKHLQQPQHVKQQLLQQQQQQHPNSKDNVSYLVLECDTILQPLNSSSNNNPNAINSSSNNSAVNSTGNINGSNNNNNIKLDCHSFITHHTMDMKFIYCDDNIKHLLGYSPDELVGTSLYEYHHVHDSSLVFNAFKTLFTKGQMISGLYRFLARHGGYAWVETQASLVRNPQTDRPQSVICISSVVSGIVHEDSILSFLQQRQPCKLPKQKIISICSPSETALNLIQRRSNVASLLKVEKRDDENVAMVVEKQSSTLSPSSAKIDCTVNNASASKVEDVEFKNKKNVGENLMVFNNYNNANHKLMSDRNNLNDNINISCNNNNNNNNNDADDVVIESMDDVDVSPVNYSIINHSSLEIMGEIEIGNDGFVTNDNSSNSNNDNGSNSNDNDSDDVDVNDYDCFRKSFNDHHHHHEFSHHYNEDYDKNNDGKINDNDIDVMFATEIILSNIKNAMQKSENNEGHNDQHFNMDDTKLPSHMSSTLPCISSTASLYKLLNELEDEEDELRAPFIPLDDLIFANDPSISNDVNNKNILNNNDNNILVINAGDITPSMRPLFYINDNINAANEGTAKVAQVQQNFKNIPIAVIVNKETAQLISTDKLLQNTSHQSQPHHHQQQQHQQQQQQHQQQQHQQQQQQQHNQQQQLNLDINNCFNTSKYLVLSKFKNNADHQIMNNSNNNNNNDLNYKCQQHQPLHDLNYKQQHQQQQQQQQHQLQQQQQLQNHDPLSTSSSSTFNPIQFLTCQSNNNNNQQHSNNTAQQINYLFNKIDGLNDHATNNKINGHNCNNNMSSSSSVLKNLLLKGEDTNYGYRLKVDVLRPPYQQHELQQQHQHELQQQHQQEQQYQQQQQQQQQQHELQHSPNNVDVRSFDKSQPLTATQTSSAAETVDTITTYHHHLIC